MIRLLSLVLKLFGFRRLSPAEVVKQAILVVMIMAMVAIPAPTQAAPLEQAPLPAGCTEMAHHTPSPWVVNGIRAGAGIGWANGSGTFIYAIQVAECGGLWLIGIWRHGQFVTNFFPKIDLATSAGRGVALRAGWNYIQAQIRGLQRVKIPRGFAIGIYFPYHFVKVGPRAYDGCWVDQWNYVAPLNAPNEPYCKGFKRY